MIQLLCLDVDGTLLNSHKELPAENKKAIHYAIEKGVQVYIATGRSMRGIEHLFQELEIPRKAICLSGGLIYDQKKIYSTHLDHNAVEKIVDLVEKYQSQVFLSMENINITNGQLAKELQVLVDNGSLKSAYHFCKDYEELHQQATLHKREIIKAAIKEFDEKNYTLLKQELIDLDLFNVAKSDLYFVDVTSRDCHKGKAIQHLAKYLNIPLSDVMCIGDNENDKEMIQTAGIGIAMGNAVKEVKEIAVDITTSNDECGVAQAIYKYIGG